MEVSILDPPRRSGLGNAVLCVRIGNERRVLKVYGSKTSRFEERVANVWAPRVLHRSGVDAASRAATERRCLRDWRGQGLDVFCLLDAPVPPVPNRPMLWLEYCPGRRLSDLLNDSTVSQRRQLELIHRVGIDVGRRHEMVEELGECRFVHYNASTKHIFVNRDRLITFDFEGSYLPGFPVRDALTRELSSFVHCLDGLERISFQQALDAFVAGYGRRDRLRNLVERVTKSVSPYRLLIRAVDQFNPRRKSKTHGLLRLQEKLL